MWPVWLASWKKVNVQTVLRPLGIQKVSTMCGKKCCSTIKRILDAALSSPYIIWASMLQITQFNMTFTIEMRHKKKNWVLTRSIMQTVEQIKVCSYFITQNMESCSEHQFQQHWSQMPADSCCSYCQNKASKLWRREQFKQTDQSFILIQLNALKCIAFFVLYNETPSRVSLSALCSVCPVS